MSVAENLKDIKTRIEKAARAHGQEAEKISIVAVSKLQPEERVRAALEAGQKVFGENRVQEAQERWGELKKQYADLELHLVGPLQTNKVKDAVKLFDVIQSVDREKLARALADEMKKQQRDIPCLIQVNTGEEPQKAGVAPSDLPALLDICVKCGLKITGLMCIPPEEDPPALHFALLKKLAAQHNLKDLSMGMSGDYEKAAALGATYVRIGSAIFGERS